MIENDKSQEEWKNQTALMNIINLSIYTNINNL
jgi:hypothetical protein